MTLEQLHINALDVACAKSRDGTRGSVVLTSSTLNIKVDGLGDVVITVHKPGRSLFDDLKHASMERSCNGSISFVTPAFDDWEITFIPA